MGTARIVREERLYKSAATEVEVRRWVNAERSRWVERRVVMLKERTRDGVDTKSRLITSRGTDMETSIVVVVCSQSHIVVLEEFGECSEKMRCV